MNFISPSSYMRVQLSSSMLFCVDDLDVEKPYNFVDAIESLLRRVKTNPVLIYSENEKVVPLLKILAERPLNAQFYVKSKVSKSLRANSNNSINLLALNPTTLFNSKLRSDVEQLFFINHPVNRDYGNKKIIVIGEVETNNQRVEKYSIKQLEDKPDGWFY